MGNFSSCWGNRGDLHSDSKIASKDNKIDIQHTTYYVVNQTNPIISTPYSVAKSDFGLKLTSKIPPGPGRGLPIKEIDSASG